MTSSLNKHIANLRDLNLNNGNNNHHKFLMPSNLPLAYPGGSPSPSLEPTDLSCKSSPRSSSRNSGSNISTNGNGKRFNEIDSESMSDELDSDGGTSLVNISKKSKIGAVVMAPISSRSPISSSPISDSSSPSEEDNSSPINLAASSRCRDFSRERDFDSSHLNIRDNNNNNTTNGCNNVSRKAKPKPPPITGIKILLFF